MSVKVAVRVRPFNDRELKKNSKSCVKMVGKTTIIIDKETGAKKNYTFDYSFWSHDGFETTPEGLYVATNDHYADQKTVYNALGKEVLDNAWQGYHCCLFAYGQTGSGKSYSMIGYGANHGIVPMATNEIFERIRASQTDTQLYQVSVSMLEIYNERVQDLLIPPDKRPSGGLKVRESRAVGVFVQNLTQHPVNSYESIENKMEEGNKNRTIGATLMNASSSRAHTIITIRFNQIKLIGTRKAEKFSVINLVDLAGSEKVGQTGATADRLKEGCAINKSLTVLGQVISALAEKAMGKGKKEVVPYRESALTRILQNALGGNAKTIMICAISPANINFEESLNTLRYADRAKKIVNKAVINESPHEKLIRELKQENERLKKMLSEMKEGGALGNPNDRMELQEAIESNMLAFEDALKPYEDRVEEAKHDEVQRKHSMCTIDLTLPFITNLNEDPQMNNKVFYSFQNCPIHVGRRNCDMIKNDIILGEVGILPNHAVFNKEIVNDVEEIILSAMDEEAQDNIFVNGRELTEKTLLKHNDRIIFGTNAFFVFKYPIKEEAAESDILNVDWELACNEKNEVTKEARELEKEEQRRREEEAKMKNEMLENRFMEEKMKMEEEIKKMREAYEGKIEKMEQKTSEESAAAENSIRKETEQMKEKLIEMEEEKRQREEEREKEIMEQKHFISKQKEENHDFSQKISKFLPSIREANLSAKAMQRAVEFQLKIINVIPNNPYKTPLEDFRDKKVEMVVQITNKEEGTCYIWSEVKFTNRLFIIKEYYDEFMESKILPRLDRKNDPFWDPPEPQLIGQAYYSLKPLAFLIDNPNELTILGNSEDGNCGKLVVNVRPVDEDGMDDLPDELIPEEPEDLLNRSIDFIVEITEAKELPYDFCTGVYCEYQFYLEEKKYVTDQVKEKTQNPKFNYSVHHNIDLVTEGCLKYLCSSALCIKIYGYTDSIIKKAISDSNAKKQIKPKLIAPEEPNKIEGRPRAESKKTKQKTKKNTKGKSQKDETCIIF